MNNIIAERNKRYNKYVDSVSPKSGTAKSLWNSFWVGGLTCMIGQAIFDLYGLTFPNLTEQMLGNITSMTIVTIAILFTGLGFYDVIGRKGGAGSFLPITGFANAVASPAIDFKAEGLVTGMAAKMFTVAGPVIVFGVAASVLYGVVLMLL